ncbi:MAG: phosphoribosylformylglycinamidine synthase subunit PurQ [Nannocystaceae bacterium]
MQAEHRSALDLDLGYDRARASDVRVLVLTGYGLNCEAETEAAFTRLGASVDVRHVADVIDDGEGALRAYRILAFIGGFSFGDHIASGRVYANRLRFRLGDRLARFIDDRGLAIGLCNGFQTLVKLGALPALDRVAGDGLARQSVTLMHNDRVGYRDAWVRLKADPASPCLWTAGLGEAIVEVPSRHGEGKLVIGDPATAAAIDEGHLVPLRYVDAAGAPTEAWPENPSGSPGGAAALCDRSGRIFGMMPHPEAYLDPENHPRWRAQQLAGTLPPFGLGLRILAGGVRAAIDGR